MSEDPLVPLFKRLLSRIGEVLDARLRPVNERLDRLERLLEDVAAVAKETAADVDGLDRLHRPYGDGTKLPRDQRRW